MFSVFDRVYYFFIFILESAIGKRFEVLANFKSILAGDLKISRRKYLIALRCKFMVCGDLP